MYKDQNTHWVATGDIPPVRDCRDEKDHKFLEVALATGADDLISGDQDLLVLDPYCGIRILTPADFGKMMDHDPLICQDLHPDPIFSGDAEATAAVSRRGMDC